MCRVEELNRQAARWRSGADKGANKKGTLAALIEHYKGAPEFRNLADKTRKDYSRYLEMLAERFGDLKVATMPREFVFALRDRYADTPRTANYVISVLRRLMNFAVDRGWRTDNPVLRPRLLKTGPGHKIWTAEAEEKFRAVAPPEMVLAMDLAIYTGQREGDILRMTWQQYDGTTVEVVQSKTKAKVWIPIHRDLKARLDALTKSSIFILTTRTGRPFKADHFRHQWRKAILDAGLDGHTFHGLRHTAADRLAEAGCSDREIMAITGHRTHAMVSRYLQGADQKNKARAAITKLERRRQPRAERGDGDL